MRGLFAVVVLLLSGCAAGAGTGGEPPTGQELAASKNCVSCHTVSGARSLGPTWRSLFGSEVELEGGGVAVADAAYVERSIRKPQADIVAGYTVVSMPLIDLTDAEVAALVAYIESLGRSGSLS